MTPRNVRQDGTSTPGKARNFTLRLTEAERATLDSQADRDGTDASTVVRGLIATLPAPKVPDTLRCVSDVYDRAGGTYADVAEFLAMCAACFGETPTLVECLNGWHDRDGRLVLVPA